MFCIPGLFHYNSLMPSNPETGEVRGTFTLITRAANPVMRQIHNSGDNAHRMPLFLTKDLRNGMVETGPDRRPTGEPSCF